MSKMNELATTLDDLVSAAIQMKMCAQDLITAANALRAYYEPTSAEAPEAASKKPPTREKPKAHEPEPPAEEPAPAYTKEEIRGMLSALAGNGYREEAKALVAKYANGGSLSEIDPARYPELAEEVEQYG